jgi:hypothetical protein
VTADWQKKTIRKKWKQLKAVNVLSTLAGLHKCCTARNVKTEVDALKKYGPTRRYR